MPPHRSSGILAAVTGLAISVLNSSGHALAANPPSLKASSSSLRGIDDFRGGFESLINGYRSYRKITSKLLSLCRKGLIIEPISPPTRQAPRDPMPIAWVIEDDEHIAKLLCFILEREWFKVKHVPDGREAKRLVAQDAPPAILLMDIMLPYADGFELLAHMRTKPGWEKVRIMMLTAKGGERDIARALDSGADDYVVKPFQPDEIKARLRRLLRRTP